MKKRSSATLDNLDASRKFSLFMDSLSIKEHTVIVEQISKKCMVSRAVIYSWKSCRSGIKPIFRLHIEEVAKRKIFS